MPRSDNTALLIIDVQNDFCPDGALAVSDGDEVVPLINDMQREFAVSILTQDWHPSDHSSFADNHENAQPFTLTKMPYGDQVLWPRHCVQGSTGAALHSDLKTNKADLIIRKGFRAHIDSYSAFFENDHSTPTGLEGYLTSRAITDLVLVGLATDFCVNFSAQDAASLGFKTSVRMDACRAIDMDGSLTAAVDAMKSAGVTLV
jgi:nicotinamidase/pyrazinamidase